MAKARIPGRKSAAKAQAKKPAPVGDVTRTARSAAFRGRLVAAQGRRVVVDMPAPAVKALEALLAKGYGTSQKEVVCNAVLEAAAKRLEAA